MNMHSVKCTTGHISLHTGLKGPGISLFYCITVNQAVYSLQILNSTQYFTVLQFVVKLTAKCLQRLFMAGFRLLGAFYCHLFATQDSFLQHKQHDLGFNNNT